MAEEAEVVENNYRGAGGGGGGSAGGFNTPPLRIDASGRVDQGFGPVGGAAAAADPDFDIFGIDDPSTFQTQPQTCFATTDIVCSPILSFSYFWSFV